MMWLIEGTLVIFIALLIVLIICKCKDCADKFEDK
jgi:hypothetical protein